NQVVGLTHVNGTGQSIASYRLSYDASGRLVQSVDKDGSTSYQYNAVDEVTGASTTNPAVPSESFSYDAGGNILSNDTGSSSSLGKDNRLLSNGAFDYTYDNNGNLITRTAIGAGSVTDYTWDYRNRLTDVVDRDGTGRTTRTVHYTYDALNRRISESVDGSPGQGISPSEG